MGVVAGLARLTQVRTRARRSAVLATLVLVASLASAGEASAETCSHLGASGDWNSGLSWDCGHAPGPGDSAVIGNGDHPFVSANPLAEPGQVFIRDSGRIVFTNEAAMRVGELDVATGSITGAGSLTVEGEFTKGGQFGAHFAVTNQGIGGPAPDLVLDGPGTLGGGAMCVGRSDDASPDHPSMAINEVFTIADPLGDLSPSPFNCTSGPRVTINAPNGHLIHDADQVSWLQTMIVNDGKITASQGELQLSGTGGQTSDGAYLAAEGAELQFDGSYLVGPSGRVGGAGTIDMKALPMTMAAGATLDPAVLDLSFGHMNLEGSAPVTLPVFKLNGVLDSDRPVTATAMSVTAGALQDDFTLTVPPGGSFAKTGDGTFAVTNSGAEGSADLVLDADATVGGGRMCVARTGDQDPDQPNLRIDQDFTIGSAVPSDAFQCGPQFGTLIHVNGPGGHLSKAGPGTMRFNDLDVAGGTLSVASGQTFVFANTYAQSAGVTEIASGGTLEAAPTLTGGVLRGSGQITGNLTNTAGTVRPGSSPGSLTVGGNYTQGASGTLEVDVNGTAQGTQYDRLSVGGAASLDGTLAVVKGAGFAPQPADTFQFLTSASRTGTFASLTGEHLPDGNAYSLDYPGSPEFGARLLVTGPSDFVITDCDDPDLATVTAISGDLVADSVPDCDALELPALEQVAGDLLITGNDSAEAIGLGGLGSVGGDLTITGNGFADVIGIGELDSVAGDLTITDNGDATVALGTPGQLGGDLTLETTGSGPLALGDGSPAGNLDLDTAGYAAVSGATGAGSTTIESEHPEAVMRTVLPSGAFTAPVDFTLTRIDPAALPPQDGAAAGGGAAVVDPVAAYQFGFGVPTLNQDATLTFEVQVDGLDPATRADFLAAVEAGNATLATRGDAPGGSYQAFPLCAAGVPPTADGCVRVEKLDANGQPTTGVPAAVRFTGVTGHFSAWAVATVTRKASPGQSDTGTGTGGGNSPAALPAFASKTLVTLRLARNRIPAKGPLKVRVANANSFAITGRLAGETVQRVAAAPRRRVKLPAKAFRAAARTRKTVALGLPRTLRSLLRSRGRLALRITANVTDPAGQRRVVKRRLTPRLRTR